MIPTEDNARFIRGHNDGIKGLSPTDATEEYLKGYLAGRKRFLEESSDDTRTA